MSREDDRVIGTWNMIWNMIGSGLSCELFVNHLGNFLFYLDISTRFITGAEPAYHGGITGFGQGSGLHR